MEPEISIDDRNIGKNYPPMVIAEIGINHDDDFEKQKKWFLMLINKGQNV